MLEHRVRPEPSLSEITKTASASDASAVLELKQAIISFKQEYGRLLVLDACSIRTRHVFSYILCNYWCGVKNIDFDGHDFPMTLKVWGVSSSLCSPSVAKVLRNHTRQATRAMQQIKSNRARRLALGILKFQLPEIKSRLDTDCRYAID